MEEAFIKHCTTCNICSDNGGNYRLCTTGSSLCAGETPPYLNASGAWEKQPNVKEHLAFYFFNQHAKICNTCSSACVLKDARNEKVQDQPGLCGKGNRLARKVVKRFWMDGSNHIRRAGLGSMECVLSEESERGKVIWLKERDILLPKGQGEEFGGILLQRERNEKMAGGEFVRRRKTFRERFNMGR